jgi:hypothetical protein
MHTLLCAEIFNVLGSGLPASASETVGRRLLRWVLYQGASHSQLIAIEHFINATADSNPWACVPLSEVA